MPSTKRKRDEASEAPGVPDSKPKRPPTEFEERLHQLCKCIPAGKVSTYGAMAVVLHSSARAVGQALRRNPFAPVVPCHRVVAADRYIGGFSGSWGHEESNVKRKRAMLEEEGVRFEGAHVLEAYVLDAGELQQCAEEAAAGVGPAVGAVAAGSKVRSTAAGPAAGVGGRGGKGKGKGGNQKR